MVDVHGEGPVTMAPILQTAINVHGNYRSLMKLETDIKLMKDVQAKIFKKVHRVDRHIESMLQKIKDIHNSTVVLGTARNMQASWPPAKSAPEAVSTIIHTSFSFVKKLAMSYTYFCV